MNDISKLEDSFVPYDGKETLTSDAVGMPDEQDKEFLRKLILKFDKKYPGFIKTARDEARKELEASSTAMDNKLEYGVVEAAGMSSARRSLVFELPEELMANIEKVFPSMFRDRKHFAWFATNFKELLVPDKYEPRAGFKFNK